MTDSATISISGTCDAAFEPLREELAAQLATGNELGASIVVDIDGDVVVDMWGGWTDAEHSAPWERDTIVNVWSTSKTLTNLCALMLVDRGQLDAYAPVATYWPEFAANGKEQVAVRHLLSHTSGVSGWEGPFAVEDMYDREASTAALAAQAPWWEPGSASGYHALNQGHLVGEVIRRVSGKTLTQFVADEVAGPLGADWQIGAREQDWDRIAPVVAPPPLPVDLAAMDPRSPVVLTFTGPAADANFANTPGWRQAEIGAANSHANARSVARVISALARGGTVDGVRLLGQDAIDVIFDEQSNGVDLVLGVPVRFGIGYALPETQTVPYLPQGRTCFWGGWGGSLVYADLDRRMTVAYMMNRMAPGIIGSDRSEAYVRAVTGCLG